MRRRLWGYTRKLRQLLHHMVEIWWSPLNATLSPWGSLWENQAFQQMLPKMIRKNTLLKGVFDLERPAVY
jgi:hypothetical protein